jgi:hypothetical protein
LREHLRLTLCCDVGVHGRNLANHDGIQSTTIKGSCKTFSKASNGIYSRPAYPIQCMWCTCDQLSLPCKWSGSSLQSRLVSVQVRFYCFSMLHFQLCYSPGYDHRKWDSNDVSNVNTIGDNYETSVIFIITGYQYISSAAAYNFGYTYRASWFRNYVFVFFFTGKLSNAVMTFSIC